MDLFINDVDRYMLLFLLPDTQILQCKKIEDTKGVRGYNVHIMELSPKHNCVGDQIEFYYIDIETTNNKGNNKITELRTILQRESQNS